MDRLPLGTWQRLGSNNSCSNNNNRRASARPRPRLLFSIPRPSPAWRLRLHRKFSNRPPRHLLCSAEEAVEESCPARPLSTLPPRLPSSLAWRPHPTRECPRPPPRLQFRHRPFPRRKTCHLRGGGKAEAGGPWRLRRRRGLK